MNQNFDALFNNKEKAFLYKSLLLSKETAEANYSEAILKNEKEPEQGYLKIAQEFEWCTKNISNLITKIFGNTLIHDSVFLSELFQQEHMHPANDRLSAQ